MKANALLEELQRLGVILAPAGDRLRYSAPSGVLSPALRHELATHKTELLALLSAEDPEVLWRVEAMRPQVPLTGAIPFLVAREILAQRDCCLGCGDSLPPGNKYRCAACAKAAYIVINQVREGVPLAPRAPQVLQPQPSIGERHE